MKVQVEHRFSATGVTLGKEGYRSNASFLIDGTLPNRGFNVEVKRLNVGELFQLDSWTQYDETDGALVANQVELLSLCCSGLYREDDWDFKTSCDSCGKYVDFAYNLTAIYDASAFTAFWLDLYEEQDFEATLETWLLEAGADPLEAVLMAHDLVPQLELS